MERIAIAMQDGGAGAAARHEAAARAREANLILSCRPQCHPIRENWVAIRVAIFGERQRPCFPPICTRSSSSGLRSPGPPSADLRAARVAAARLARALFSART